MLEISTEQFDWTVKTNIYAPFWIIKAAFSASGKKNRQQLTTQLTDMIPEGESIKPDDEDLDNSEGDEIPAPDDENKK